MILPPDSDLPDANWIMEVTIGDPQSSCATSKTQGNAPWPSERRGLVSYITEGSENTGDKFAQGILSRIF